MTTLRRRYLQKTSWTVFAVLAVVVGAGCKKGSSCADQPTRPDCVASTTTSVSTTTTSVAPQSSAHYVGTVTGSGGAQVPFDLSLFFGLPTGALLIGAFQPTAIYPVDGGFTAGSVTGSVTGTLDGTPPNGTFTGVLKTVVNGCVAQRNYSGPLTASAVNWAAGSQIENCGGQSPLTFTPTVPAATTPPTVGTTIPSTSTTTTSVPGGTTSSTTTTTAGSTSTTTTTTAPPGSTTSTTTSTSTTTTAPSVGTLSGIISSAASGLPISGATVAVGALSTQTNGSGQYTLSNVPAGGQTVATSASGFTSRTDPVTVVASQTTTFSTALAPVSNNFTVVVTWGSVPDDLDVHMTGPNGTGGRFHVYFDAQNPVPHASLDNDDTNGFGPETITISSVSGNFVAGEYRFYVENYSQSPEFNASGAVATVFQNGAQIAQYSVGSASGNPVLDLWHVFNFTLSATPSGNISFSTVQQFVTTPPSVVAAPRKK